MTVTPEATGSSPVDPANRLQASPHVKNATDRHGVPRGAQDQPGPVIHLPTHLQRLEWELEAFEAARERITSRIGQIKKILQSSRSTTATGPTR
jgi:hypothetical protein